MSKKNPYSIHERELNEIARRYEQIVRHGKDFYMEADDLADLADWYFSNQEENTAWEVLEYGLSVHPDNTTLLVEKANLLIEVDLLAEAQEIAESIIGADGDDEVFILRAKLLILQGNEEAAEEMLDYRNESIDMVGVAYMYLETDRPKKALEWLQKGKMLEEEEDESYLAALADCFQALKRYEESAAVINKLIDFDPYCARYWYGLAVCNYHLQQYDKVIEALDFAIVSDEDYGSSYLLRGDVYVCLDNRTKAREDYAKAVELNALAPEFLEDFDLDDLMHAGKWEPALRILQNKLEKIPKGGTEQARRMVQYAFCLIHMNHTHEEIVDWLERALALDVENAAAYVLLGRIKMEEEKQMEAVELWKKALQIEPFDTTWESIANHCLAIGCLDYMELCYQKVREIRPEDKFVNVVLTILNIALGREEKVREYNQCCERPFSEQEIEDYRVLFSLMEDKRNLSGMFMHILKDNYERHY